MAKFKKTFNVISSFVLKGRVKMGYTQVQLSNMMGYKNSQFISNVERGLCGFPVVDGKKLCEILCADIDEMYDCYRIDFVSNTKRALYGDKR